MDQHSREQQAEQEVGRTTFARGVALSLVAGFLLVLVAVPVADTVRDPSRAAAFFSLLPARFEVEQVLGSEGAFAGSMALNRRLHQNMEQFESGLEQGTLLRDWFVGPVNRAVTLQLGGRNADVCRGREGWLFYGPALDHLTGPPFLSRHPEGADPVAVLTAFRDQLAARGVALVVMPIPVKASIYPERLSGAFDGQTPVFNPSHEPMVAALRARGILVCDPAPALLAAKASGATYLAGDSHWTPHGQRVAIEYLRDYLNEEMPDLPVGHAGFQAGPAVTVSNGGDLVALLLPGQSTEGGEAVTLGPVLGPDGAPWAPETDAPILLLGDSYANIFELEGMGWGTGAGMAAQLSLALQRPVDAITQNGDGAFATRLALNQELGRGVDRLAGKQVLIFAFSARELSLGDWKPSLALAQPKTESAKESAATPVTGSGVLAAQSTPPEPGSVPYKDCLIAARLQDVQGVPGDPESILVYRWGMRDNVWTPATRQRSGDALRLILQPWDSVAGELGSYNRVDLEEDSALNVPVWWEVEPAPVDHGDGVAVAAKAVLPDTSGLELSSRVRAMEAAGAMVHEGEAGWLYFLPELRFLQAGPFWGEAAVRASHASNPDFADPLPAIVDFHQQLAAQGIALFVAPVPAKASLYGPESGILELDGSAPAALERFMGLLAEAGVQTVDLLPAFQAARDGGEAALYCRQDTHWSPFAITLAARQLAECVQALPWYAAMEKKSYPVTESTVTPEGDLWALLPEPRPAAESLPLWRVGGVEPPAVDRESPVLLIGDSHNLVFHAGGDMHAQGAGLPDHLAAELGFPVDLVAVRGSGATTPRINLARRRDNLAGKRAVIWCFTVREFTESITGWRPIPVIQ